MDSYRVDDGQPEFFIKFDEDTQFLHLKHKCSDGFCLVFPSSLCSAELFKLYFCFFVLLHKSIVPGGVLLLVLSCLRILRNAAFCQFGHNIDLLKQGLDFLINTRAVRQRRLHQSAVLKNGAFAVEDGIKGGNEPCLDSFLIEMGCFAFIKRKPYGTKILVKVKDEVKLVIDATSGYEPYDRQRIIEQNKKNAVRHAYFREYLALQRLCLLILRHQKHQIGSGSKQIYGILFDGAWLWEEYVNSLIDEIFYHPMNKGGKGAQRLFEGNIGLIYPDFISRDNEARIIADAKYKPIDNIGNRDYLQVLAYMFRFDAKAGFYLYPEAEGADDMKLRLNQGSTYESNVMPRDDISITKHGLKIPADTADYEGFAARMRINEQEFVRAFS